MTTSKVATERVYANGKLVKPTVRIETITPAKAEKILEDANVRNRDLRESRITFLAAAIERDEWQLTNDALAFDAEGLLLNGQHRLAACVAADKSIQVVVLRNLPAKAQDVMDGNLTRKLGDALRLRGMTDQHLLGAGIAWYARILYAEAMGVAHYQNNALRPSIPQLLSLFERNPGLRDAQINSGPVRRALKLRGGPLVAVYYRLSQIDADDCTAFFDQLRSGVNLTEESPILALRRYSEEERNSVNVRRRNPDFKWVAVCVKAWNAYREGRPIKVLSYRYTPAMREEWPEPI